MPFKSEAQRKYLWANEPEIARDWTDTYGSKIHKADGGRIGFAKGDRPPGQPKTGLHYGYGKGEAGKSGGPDRGPAHLSHNAPPPLPKVEPKDDGWINRGLSYLENKQKKGMTSYFDRNKARYENKLRKIYGITEDDDLQKYMSVDPLQFSKGTGAKKIDTYIDKVQEANVLNKAIESGEFTQADFTARLNKLNPPPPDRGEGGQIPWWLQQPAPVASTPDTTTASTGLGGGHFQVPIDLVVNQTRAAEGGLIGSVGGISRPKYQEGNMVGAEMEGAEMGAEMEGAMMQSKEVIKELYDALIAQGLSPQEAMEKIKEIIAGTQAQGPESPMMGEEFPGQEFGRAPAAFGGIMDTYTGRRKYGLGSSLKKLVSKGTKAIKKLASSKLGKLALMYAAGTYLGGTQAFGGEGLGWKKFGARLLDPMGGQGIGNIFNPTGGLGKGKGWSYFQKAAPKAIEGGSMLSGSHLEKTKAMEAALAGEGMAFKGSVADVLAPAAKSNWSKYILPASIAAGAYTAMAPVPELDDTQEEWDKEKAKWDARYAGMEGAYRLPEDLRLPSAQGGRIGYGLGSWVKGALGLGKKEGSAEAHPGAVAPKDPEVLRERLLDYFKTKLSGEDYWEGAQGGRIGRQEGGLMNLGGMEKDYRNDGGFVPLGGEEKADDVPARLSKNEFVFTADAVRNAGGGDIDKGAEVMENVMKNLEGGGKVSEESQGQGAQEMFETSERLSEVI